MSSYYTVIQYVPDPIADERINIGIITWSTYYHTNSKKCYKFVDDWSGVQKFGGEDITFLKDFARDLIKSFFNPKDIEKLIVDWTHSVQFTPKRGSLLEPIQLIDQLADKFLVAAKVLADAKMD